MKTLLVSPGSQGQRLALIPRSTSPDFFYDPQDMTASLDSIFKGRVVRVHPHYALVDIGLDRPGILSLSLRQPKPTEGQYLLVQIKRESMEDMAEFAKEFTPHKGVQLTTQIRLTHRYFHYHPDRPHRTISPKISPEAAIILSTYLPPSSPVTLRVAASALPAQTLVNAVQEVEDLYQNLRDVTKIGLALTGPTALVRLLRDQESLAIIVNDWATSAQLQPQLWPGQTITVTPNPFQAFDMEDLWQSLLQPVVPFGQGGSLLFEHPSGLTVIDINTGGQTPTNANAAAVPLLLQHLRWRHLSGNILIDFVDSRYAQQRSMIVRSINQHLLANPGASFEVLGWSATGHLQLRRPVRIQPLWMKLGHLCTTCAGWGRVL